ncbi:TPA: hypothetical protein QFT23_005305 [Bacillus cereus]|nr:hypothetical protein [Bacillus cereus]
MPNGSKAYVINSLDRTVSVINTATNTELLPRILVGDILNNYGIAITPDGSRVYVCNTFDDNISVINTATDTEILPRFSVGTRPSRIAITPNCV